jgi:hypothetical protein
VIPRKIHFIWLGGKPYPEEYARFREGWARNNPGWDVITWTEATLPELRNQAAYDAADTWAGKADIARLEILLREGGVYVDCDFESLRPIEPLLDGVEFLAARDWGDWIPNTLMGSTAGHPVVEELVDAIPARMAANPGGPPNEISGPHLLTEVVGAREPHDPGIKIFPKEVFYPYPYEEKELHHVGEDHPGACAVHHWAATWIKRRVVVAIDPESWQEIAGVVGTFCRLFGPDDAVQLVLATPGPADEATGARVQELLAAVVRGDAELPELWLSSYAEAAEENYDMACVTPADPAASAVETAAAVEWMTRLRLELDGGAATRLPAPRMQAGGLLAGRFALAAAR